MKKITLSLFVATIMGSTLFASPASIVENYINTQSGVNTKVNIKCADKGDSIICGTRDFSKTKNGVSISFDKFAFIADSKLGHFLEDYDINAVKSYKNYQSLIQGYKLQKMYGNKDGKAPVMNESAKIGKKVYDTKGDYEEKIFKYIQKVFFTGVNFKTEDGLDYSIGELMLKKTHISNSFNKPITGNLVFTVKDVKETFNSKIILAGLKEAENNIMQKIGNSPQKKQLAKSILYIVKKIVEKDADKNGNYSVISNGKVLLSAIETSKGTINVNLKAESKNDKKDSLLFELNGDIIGISNDAKHASDGKFNKLIINSENPSIKIMAELIKSDEIFKTHIQRVEGLIDMGKGMSSSFITDVRLSELARDIMEKVRGMLYGKEENFYFSITNKTGITGSKIAMESQKVMMNMNDKGKAKRAPDSVIADAVYKNFDIVFK